MSLPKPIVGYGCEGSFDTDAQAKHLSRPFRHKTVGRSNWKRKVRKAQRREWNKAVYEHDRAA